MNDKNKEILAILLSITTILILYQTNLGFVINDALIEIKDTNNQIVDARCITLNTSQDTVDNRKTTQFPNGKYGCNIKTPEPGLYTLQVSCSKDSSIRDSQQFTSTSGTICIGDLGYNICEGTGITLSCPQPTTTTTITDSTTTLPTECVWDSECGESGYTGETYCSEGDVRRTYISYKCSDGVCESSQENILIDGCRGSEDCINGECVETETTTTIESTTTTIKEGDDVDADKIVLTGIVTMLLAAIVLQVTRKK